jgi:hypothetical protein
MNFEKIQTELDYYQKFAPVNFAEERTTFFECLKKKSAIQSFILIQRQVGSQRI